MGQVLLHNSRTAGSFYRGHPALFHADYTLARGARGPLLPVRDRVLHQSGHGAQDSPAVSTRGRHLQLPDFSVFPRRQGSLCYTTLCIPLPRSARRLVCLVA